MNTFQKQLKKYKNIQKQENQMEIIRKSKGNHKEKKIITKS